MLFSESFERLAVQCAWIGTVDRNSLTTEIRELYQTRAVPAGFKKSVSHFWKKHKKEILVGGGILVALTTIAVIGFCTGGTAASGAAALGGKAIDHLNDILDSKELPSKKPSAAKSGSQESNPVVVQPSQAFPEKPPHLQSQQLTFNENGVLFQDQFASYEELLQSKPGQPANRTWLPNLLDTIGKGIIDNPELFDPNIPLPSHELSKAFFTLGEKAPWLGLGGINGINTSQEEAVDHANHLAKFSKGYSVDWVYNRSHGPVVDVLEVVALNFSGASPNTADLLLEQWSQFHKQNADRPNAKFLQFCHSQAAIHVRNGLAKAPPEIRNRIIVEAFAPAAVIPKKLCFQVEHYACKGDPIPHAEIAYAGIAKGPLICMDVAEEHKNIIWVDPDPETKSPHDFQNPAFDDIKEKVIKAHIMRNGEY